MTITDLHDPAGTTTPEAARPRLRQAVTSQVRRAGGAVRQNPKPASGVLVLAGGVLAVLLLRRRAARTRAAQARKRWVPARFQR